ncbi:PD-(D/E)XK nuclease family protein [Pseudoramibacter porci]|uniref:DNA helicase n=1 Tax=Pseudoramibacter porci TaxID=2606631 RepID=A0A7X2TBH2_9FIRM|nr:PD-(D/E)XK nuclease family protein [Pseudoramibacter porci]MSS20576.1 hypothetical protein [Pseudoramibacter porci]
MLRIIAGRYDKRRPTMTQLVDREIAARLKNTDAPILLIVPEQFTLGAEQALIREGGLKGLLGVDVLSLKRLAARVFEETGQPKGQAVDEHGRQMLLTRAVLGCGRDLKVYQKSAAQGGFQKKIADFIGEFKANQLNAADLDAAMDQVNPDRLLSRKLMDIKTILTAYEGLLGDERFDEADRAKLVAQAVGKSRRIAETAIYLDGFHTFSESDFNIVGALIAAAPEVTMTLITDDVDNGSDGAIFEIAEQTKRRLMAMARDAGQDVEVIDADVLASQYDGAPKAHPDAGDLARLESQCFAAIPKASGDVPAHIEISECSDLWSEAEEAARKIVALTRDGGLHYADIGILVGSPEAMGGTIRRVLSFYDIPCFVDAPKSLIGQPLVDCLIAAFETVDRHFDVRDVMAFGKSPFSPIAAEDIMDLENYAVVMGVDHSRWLTPFEKDAPDMPRPISELNGIREKIMAPLLGLEKGMKQARTYRERIAAALAFLEGLDVQKTLDDAAAAAVSDQAFEKASTDNQIWNILMTVFTQIDAALSDERCSLRDFMQVFKNGIDTYDIGILPEDPDVVDVTDPFRSRHLGKKVMIVIGANEGLLPPEASPFPILSERERREMAAVGLDLHNDRRYLQVQNQYTLYLQMASVTEKLLIYYAMKGEDGKALRRSRLVNQILNVFPKMTVYSTLFFDPEQSWDWVTGFAGTENIARAQASGSTPRVRAVANRFDAAETVRAVSAWAPSFFALDDGIADQLIGPKLVLSATDCRTYSACAWRYFLNSQLRPVPREPFEVTLPDIGNVMHRMIDAFFKELNASGLRLETLSADERDRMTDRILSDILARIHGAVFDSSAAFHYQGRKLRRMGRRTMGMLAEHLQKGQFEVVDSEHPFAYALDSAGLAKPVVIQGSIDRLDRMDRDGVSYYKVIDYKTGTDAVKPADIYYGLSPQLLGYLEAAVRYGQKQHEDAEAAAGFYFHVADPITDVTGKSDEEALQDAEKHFQMKGIFLDDQAVISALDSETDGASNIFTVGRKQSEYRYAPEGMAAILWKNQQNYRDTAQSILSGGIAPNPYITEKERACDHCGCREICGFVKEIDPNIFRRLAPMDQSELLERIEEEKHEMDN